MKKRFKDSKRQAIYEKWFIFYANKEVDGHCGSNRDGAFLRGYKNFRLSENRIPYLRTSPLYPIYRAGVDIKKHHEKSFIKGNR